MGKTVRGIIGAIEVGVGVLFQFTTGLQGVGLALIASGLATEASLLIKTPKPPQTESTQKQSRPPRMSAYCAMRSQMNLIQ